MDSIVVVDDERTFIDGQQGVLYIRSEQEAMGFLASLWVSQYQQSAPPLTELWLDHDLGNGGEVIGVARFLQLVAATGFPVLIDDIYIHSMNTVGADNILKALYHYQARRVPLPECRMVDAFAVRDAQ